MQHWNGFSRGIRYSWQRGQWGTKLIAEQQMFKYGQMICLKGSTKCLLFAKNVEKLRRVIWLQTWAIEDGRETSTKREWTEAANYGSGRAQTRKMSTEQFRKVVYKTRRGLRRISKWRKEKRENEVVYLLQCKLWTPAWVVCTSLEGLSVWLIEIADKDGEPYQTKTTLCVVSSVTWYKTAVWKRSRWVETPELVSRCFDFSVVICRN